MYFALEGFEGGAVESGSVPFSPLLTLTFLSLLRSRAPLFNFPKPYPIPGNREEAGEFLEKHGRTGHHEARLEIFQLLCSLVIVFIIRVFLI